MWTYHKLEQREPISTKYQSHLSTFASDNACKIFVRKISGIMFMQQFTEGDRGVL